MSRRRSQSGLAKREGRGVQILCLEFVYVSHLHATLKHVIFNRFYHAMVNRKLPPATAIDHKRHSAEHVISSQSLVVTNMQHACH